MLISHEDSLLCRHSKPSLCQRLDSRQLTQIRAPEARGKSSAKRERRRRESPPEAKGERSEPFAGGARDSAKRNRVFVIMAKFLSPSSHVTCQNWIRPFTKKHRFIAQIDSARSNIASTAWRPCGLSPDIEFQKMSSTCNCMLLLDIDLGPTMYLACMTMELEAI